MAGFFSSPWFIGSGNFFVLKLDQTGGVSWQKAYKMGSGDDYANSIQQTSDGGYIVVGSTYSFGAGQEDMWVLKLDQVGIVSWQKTYGGSLDDWAYSIQQTRDGGYIVAGETKSFGAGNYDMWLLKLDGNGTINNADFIGTSYVTLTDTSISGITSAASIAAPSFTYTNTTVTPHDTSALMEELCFAADWYPTDSPSQEKLNGVWGYLSPEATHKFYAVGESGTIFHFDGTNWTTTGSPTLENFMVSGAVPGQKFMPWVTIPPSSAMIQKTVGKW